MAKEKSDSEEKADSDKGGWFARWRERRKQSKLRAGERQHEAYEGVRTGEHQAGAMGQGPNVGAGIPGG